MQFVRTVDGDWVKPLTMDDLLAVITQLPPDSSYRLVMGNTAKGEERFQRSYINHL
jgi:hypothetical protein